MKPVVEDKPFEFMSTSTPARIVPVVASSAVVDEAPPRDFDIIQIVWRHKWLLLVGLVVGVGLGQMAFLKLGPEYNAVAQVLVSQRAQVPNRDEIGKAWGERAEHISIIKSAMLIDKAVAKGKLNELPTLQRSVDPVEDILECLDVRRTAGQDNSFLNVFELKIRNKNKEDARAIVNAIIVAYRDYLKESQDEVSSELSQQISKMNDDLSKKIETRQEELVAFRKEAPLIWRTAPGDRRQAGDVTNVHQERLVEIAKERTQLILRKTEISGKITALQAAVDQGKSSEELDSLIRLLIATSQSGGATGAAGAAVTTPAGATPSEQASQQMLQLVLDEQKLLKDYSDDHPEVQNVRKSMAKVKRFYEARGVVVPELMARDIQGRKANFAEIYGQVLQQQRQEIEHKDMELSRIYDTESKGVKDIVKYMVEDQARSEELERLKTQWNAIVNNVSQLDMTRDNKGYTMKLLAPVREDWSLKRYLKIVGAATVCMLGLCVGIVFLREWRDTTVKSADDVRKLMAGVPVLGTVPQFDVSRVEFNPEVPLQPSLCYFHRPGSAEAESYRAVRTALFVGLDINKQKVIQVSSPEPGDGKSTFVSNLAIALAQSGKKVLLLDADLRRPTVHRLFAARHEIGTAEVLAGEIHLANAVQESLVQNLWLLSAGMSPPNPAETLASERFERLIATARSEYDFVLVDTPPLLVVSDPCIVAPRTDGLILVVRVNKNSRASLRETNSLIQQHGIRLLGAVVNGMDEGSSGKAGYGYSNEYTDYLKPTQPALRSSNTNPRQVPANV